MAVDQTTTLAGITQTPANSSLATVTAAKQWQFVPPTNETALRRGVQVQLWGTQDWQYSTDGSNYVPIAAARVITAFIDFQGSIYVKRVSADGVLYALRVA